ncbi:unnamed protein product, partial [Thelazia callipaeda]|uniref:Zinc finger protein unc-98 n=1 Tax=Thelazia callipaeda TaxID=103827 RepID=A0A0N5CXJ7_THECL
ISQSDNPQEEFRSTKSSDDVISPSEIPKSLSQSSPPEHEGSIQVKKFPTPELRKCSGKNISGCDLTKNSRDKILELPFSNRYQILLVTADRNSAKGESKDENGFIFYKCRFCGLTYNYLTTLRAHERVHNIDEPYKCNRCSESFHYLCELEYHAKQHTGSCCSPSAYYMMLIYICLYLTEQDLKGYKCECGRTFHTYTDLLYHKHPEDENEEVIVSKEPIKKPASSPVPEDSFPVPEFMEKGFEPKHPMKVYSDIRLNPYICQYCSKSYPNSRMLAYHMYGHRGEKIFNPRASRYLMARSETSFSRSLGSPKGTL